MLLQMGFPGRTVALGCPGTLTPMLTRARDIWVLLPSSWTRWLLLSVIGVFFANDSGWYGAASGIWDLTERWDGSYQTTEAERQRTLSSSR